MRREAELRIEGQAVPSHFRIENGMLYLLSTMRQKWYRVTKGGLMSNYGDIEMAEWTEKDEIIAIPRLKGSKFSKARFKTGEVLELERPPDKVWYPKGNLVFFELEDGVCVYLDSGSDPTDSTREMVKKLVEIGLLKSEEFKTIKLTNLKDIFEKQD